MKLIHKKYLGAILILVLAIVASQFYNSSLEGSLNVKIDASKLVLDVNTVTTAESDSSNENPMSKLGPITMVPSESDEQGTTSGKELPAEFPVKDFSSEVAVPTKELISPDSKFDFSIKDTFPNASAPSNTGSIEATTNDGGSISISTDGSLGISDVSEEPLPGCKKPVPVTLPDGEKAFMLTVYADKKVSTSDLIKSPIFKGDVKNINSILYFDKSEFKKYNASLDSVLTNTGFLQILNRGIDFTKFGLLGGRPEVIDAFHPLFLFSKTAGFGEFCQQFANSTYYEITDRSEHFDVLAMPKLDRDNNAQISNIYNDDIFKYLGVEVEVSAMPSSYAVYRVKFRETKEDRCISSNGICVEPVVGEAAVNTPVPSTPVKEIATKFIDVRNMYEGAENELLATLQVGSDMTVTLSSTDKILEEQLAFFQGNIQINSDEAGLYTLTAGDYDIRNLDEVRLSNLKDIDDFSITVAEFKGALNLTEDFQRNKMVLSFEDNSDDLNVSGTLNFEFKSVTRDRNITFDDIKNQLRLQNTNSTAGPDGATLEINNIDTKFQIFSYTTAKFSDLCCSFGGSIDLNKSSLSLSMDNPATFDLSLFGKIMTLPKGGPLEF